jgi:predicted DCC family thiol-disulfide oxidoreductase YuxK
MGDADVGPVLLYDGACGLCAESVLFVLRHDTSRRDGRPLRFAPLGGAFAAAYIDDARDDSVVWYEERALGEPIVKLRSDAVLETLRYLGGGWRLVAAAARIVPRVVRDAAYRWVAVRRYRLRPQACLLPTAEERARFLP